MDVSAINRLLQAWLRRGELDFVSAVDAAQWLNEAGLLGDSEHRRGGPLRHLLRAGRITGQRQESNNRWYIDRSRDAE